MQIATVGAERRLVPGADWPRNWPEFAERFLDEAACIAYLSALRWPHGFSCPSCQSARDWRLASGHVRCASCRRKVSVTTRTVFHRSHQPLTVWFAAAWHVASPAQRGERSGADARTRAAELRDRLDDAAQAGAAR